MQFAEIDSKNKIINLKFPQNFTQGFAFVTALSHISFLGANFCKKKFNQFLCKKKIVNFT